MSNRSAATAWAALAVCVFVGLAGCPARQPPTSSQSNSNEASTVVQRVVAQGQIMPAGGIVKIFSAPGDTVVDLPVPVGAQVQPGQTLAVLRSQATLAAQRATLQEQRRNAIREQENAVRQAKLQVTAAQLKVKQIDARREALQQQAHLLTLGAQQVQASAKILESLKRIAEDSLTREFVGRIDVDRQSLSVNDAGLELQRQQLSHQQASQEIELAAAAAHQELQAAEALLAMAEQPDPGKVFDLQLSALDAESGRSTITAPGPGVVLAIGAAVGGAAVQAPLIELADLSRLVCEAEVNVADVGAVRLGQPVTIRSRAFKEPLTGVVADKNRLVGRPRLRSLDPLAAVDYRTMVVIIDLNDPPQAQDWLQLQVEVEINVGNVDR
ncbi:MAG: HlyD family efflux transporter periplasmic adaptor subunit [Pirellulaceae bacterium]|nr:HlyD family efflux transporter periplasmic adaptor subunit [Pirellulaceae bacterium]